MKLRKWEELPPEIQLPEVREYYDILTKRHGTLIIKRTFDILVSVVLLVLFSPVFLILAIAIKLDSPGPVFYRQERVTQYGRRFRIHKFRTMVQDADKGSQVTMKNDARVTKVGKVIRGCRLDETAQLLDLLCGDMTLVGTRPESPKYVAQYTPEMMATLLLPAGVTSEASVRYKDEATLLDGAEDVDRVYVEQVLPKKMEWNLKGIKQISFWMDSRIVLKTILSVIGGEK